MAFRQILSLVLLLSPGFQAMAQTTRRYTQTEVKTYLVYLDTTMGSASEERTGDFAAMFIASPDTVLSVLNMQSKGTQKEYLSVLAWGTLNEMNSNSGKAVTTTNYPALFYKLVPGAANLAATYKWQIELLLEKIKEEL